MKQFRILREQRRKSWLSVVSTALTVFTLVFPLQALAQSDTIETNVPALKNVFANDFTIGCLLSYRNIGFASDPYVIGQTAVITPNGGYLIKYHMNAMSPGNNMKPQYTVDMNASAAAYTAASAAQKDSVDTHPVIRFNGDIIAQLNWAKRQDFTFRGHTLVWHSQTPGAGFFRTGYSSSTARLTKEKMADRMENYIKEVIRLIHEGWPGLLSAIDVVNEAVTDAGADRTTDSEWYATFGDNTYLMKAFEFARKYTVQYGETQIKLYYNDYSTHNPTKADGIVRICTPIFQAGYLDGIGMQEHDANNSPTAQQWIASYDKFAPICTEMAVTELDVTTGSGTPSASVLATQANQYAQLFKCFVERSYKSGRGRIINVSKDGLNDAYTFKTNQASSLWDGQNKCKPAFYAVVNVGLYYRSLDSLVSHANTLQPTGYTVQSWSNFATALTLARNAKDQNYSASVSADTELGKAKDELKAAISGLVKVVNAVGDLAGNTPTGFVLGQNYPNPFNPTTAISYQLSAVSFVTLTVHDMLGREVATLVSDERRAGAHSVVWDASGQPSGVYVYRLTARSLDGNDKTMVVDSKRMILMK
jgi:GH35 family endo-1,4-beta-xylanase